MSGNDEIVKLGTEVQLNEDGSVKGYKPGIFTEPNSQQKLREDLIQQYHKGHKGLQDRLKNTGKDTVDGGIKALIVELFEETDQLLGNALLSNLNGNSRDASVISVKRADVIEKALKALQAKQQFDKETGIDVESPAMLVIFTFFMDKLKDTFEELSYGAEEKDTFIRTFAFKMSNWKEELKEDLEDPTVE